jgi:hypothetical protein
MRNVTIILAASGWGAGNFATADGALTVSQHQLLKPILSHPDIHAEIYFANWHLNSHQKSGDYSIDQRRSHVLHVGGWLSRLVEIAASKNEISSISLPSSSSANGRISARERQGCEKSPSWLSLLLPCLNLR